MYSGDVCSVSAPVNRNCHPECAPRYGINPRNSCGSWHMPFSAEIETKETIGALRVPGQKSDKMPIVVRVAVVAVVAV